MRTVECLEGSVEVELVCEPAYDYGREPAAWTLVDGAGQLRPALSRPGEGRAGLVRTVVGRWSRLSHRRRRTHRGDRSVLAQLARPSAHPRPPAAESARAISAHGQEPDVHAHRCHRRRADHLTARNARRRTQLGPGLGGRRVHAVRRRCRTDRGTAACRSCTGSTAGETSPSRHETSCPATRAPTRYVGPDPP